MSAPPEPPLNLRVGEEVEIKSAEEIFRSLDSNGDRGALPFMPEMLKFCGRRFRVAKRAHKTCDTIDNRGLRRMDDAAVHLEELRCDGAAHGGCQARCMLFWKEAWLRRAGERRDPTAIAAAVRPAIDEAGLARNTQSAQGVFRCQATEMNRATTAISDWDLAACFQDLRSGNVRLRDMIRWLVFDLITVLMRHRGQRYVRWTYNRIARLLGGFDYPRYQGSLTKTPLERLDLQPGERVRIKDREAIVATLNARNRNRGLSFDVEMANFCGTKTRVLVRVEKIIDEKTGQMISFANPTIMLEGVTCQSYYKNKGCPRSIHSYWRESWLERCE